MRKMITIIIITIIIITTIIITIIIIIITIIITTIIITINEILGPCPLPEAATLIASGEVGDMTVPYLRNRVETKALQCVAVCNVHKPSAEQDAPDKVGRGKQHFIHPERHDQYRIVVVK